MASFQGAPGSLASVTEPRPFVQIKPPVRLIARSACDPRVGCSVPCGRNEPCPCGTTRTIPDPSGVFKTKVVPEKFKHCCGSKKVKAKKVKEKL